jgi:hypothetical protein
MNNHNNKLLFSSASFYTSFLPNKDNKSFGNQRQFLQSPLWQSISNTHKPNNSKSDKTKHQLSDVAKNTLQQAIYILPKSPSHVSIYLQLPKFRSLSVLMRCGHVSQLVENWLCNPMEQLKRNAEKNQQYTINHKQYRRRGSSSSPLCIMPSSSSTTTSEAGLLSVVNHKNALVSSYRKYDDMFLSSVSVHFQIPHEQQEHLKIQYANVPCLFTVVCVTYNCGTISLSVNQIDSLDFLLSPNTMNPFLVQCNLVPQHPVTVHQLVPSSSSIYHQQLQICNFENNLPQHEEESKVTQMMDSNELCDCNISKTEPWIKELHATVSTIQEEENLDDQKVITQTPIVELLHFKETLLYEQEDDDEESGMFTSDEDFSLIDEEDDMTEYDDNYHYFKAKSALLELVQDTLKYIQSSGGALTDELNNLKPKLYDYCSM